MAHSLGARHGRHKQRGGSSRDYRAQQIAASAGSFWCVLSGFTGTLAHAGAPPFAVYILAQTADKTLIVATLAVFFFVVNYVKLVPYHFIGQLNAGNLTTSLLFAPLAPLGVLLGVWLHRRISRSCSIVSAMRCCSPPEPNSSSTR